MSSKNTKHDDFENNETNNDCDENTKDHEEWYDGYLDTKLVDLYSLIKEMCENEAVYILDKPKPHNIGDFINLVKKYID